MIGHAQFRNLKFFGYAAKKPFQEVNKMDNRNKYIYIYKWKELKVHFYI